MTEPKEANVKKCWNCGTAAPTVEVPTADGYREPWCSTCIDRDERGRATPWIVAVVVTAAVLAAAAVTWSVLR